MAYDASDKYTLSLYHQGKFRVPGVEQERQLLGYNEEVEVTVHADDPDIDTLTFTGYPDSNNRVNVPKRIQRILGLEVGDNITVELEATGGRWSPDVESTARKAVYESAHPEEQNLEAVTDVVSGDD